MLNFWTSALAIIICATGTSSDSLCLETGAKLRVNDACYLFVTTPLPWHKAQAECRKKGGHLANVTDLETHEFLVSHMPEPTTSYWIGANRLPKRWRWSNGDEVHYSDWFPGEPSSPDSVTEDHVMLWAGDNLNHQSPNVTTVYGGYKWNDENGERTISNGVLSKFISQSKGTECTLACTSHNPCPNLNGHCFYLGGRYGQVSSDPNAGATWQQAKDFCDNYQSVLAEVRDAATQEALVAAINNDPNLQGNYWLGATWDKSLPPEWRWDGGGKLEYTNWHAGSGVPAGNQRETCGEMRSFGAPPNVQFQWNDENCATSKAFICQSEIPDIHCQAVGRGENSYPNYSGRLNTAMGSKMRYACEPGYTSADNSPDYMFVECLRNGSWSFPPVCLPETTTKSTTTEQRTTPASAMGSKVRYACEPGYTSADNSPDYMFVECLRNGSWSFPPVCLPETSTKSTTTEQRTTSASEITGIHCQAVGRGEKSYPKYSGHLNTAVGSKMRYACEPGYTSADKSPDYMFVECLRNGSWSFPPVCLPETTAKSTTTEQRTTSASEITGIHCQAVGRGENSYPNTNRLNTAVGSKVRYACEPGYTSADKSPDYMFVECLRNGSWSFPPVCLPETSTKSTTTEQRTTSASEIPDIHCQPVEPAGENSYPKYNGHLNTAMGSKVRYACEPGYSSAEKSPDYMFVECLRNGSWSFPPVCLPETNTKSTTTEQRTTFASGWNW